MLLSSNTKAKHQQGNGKGRNINWCTDSNSLAFHSNEILVWHALVKCPLLMTPKVGNDKI